MSNKKLLVIETHYRINPYIESIGMETNRKPYTSNGATIEDDIGQTCLLPSGRKIRLVETGAIIDEKIPIELSIRNRTGGRLISESVAINIRPMTDSKSDELLSMGMQVSHVPSNGNPI